MSRYVVVERERSPIFVVERISGRNSAIIEDVCECTEKDDAEKIQKILSEEEKV